ncbi:hypothetical protein LAZ67_9002783 [Cordylochernes scorpioides]|uniref:Uncharacterized protein n=1 Tax=Cordylochernes scorpioides TaxID=51811 RepID=A0ABY6KUJ2_9ARAC|nr:hypothetical protein LAZ67_9002783 [Cordylochernes scorpioides]
MVSTIRNRQHQTTLTRFRTGHLKPLKIENNNKIYPTCPKCSLAPAAPEHILACIRCTKQDLWERPLLIIKQLEEHELMEFVRAPKYLSTHFLDKSRKVNHEHVLGYWPSSAWCRLYFKDQKFGPRGFLRNQEMETLVFPVVTYGYESWTLSEKKKEKELKILKCGHKESYSVPWADKKVICASILNENKSGRSLESQICQQGLTYFGHINRTKGL